AFASFSEDGKKIATSGFDTETIIWETETAKQLSKLSGRTNMAYNVAFSSDGTQLAAGGRTRWDLRTGRGLRVSPADLDRTYPIPSPDGRLLAVMKANNPVLTLLEAGTGRELKALTPSGSPGVVERARFNQDGTMIVVTYGPNPDTAISSTAPMHRSTVKIWDVKSGNELQTIVPDNSPVDSDFSKDGRVLATIGSMGEISLWDTQSGSKLRDLTSSPMKSLTNIMNTQTSGSRTKMPNIANMPNMAEMADMMTNMIGSMS